MPVDPSVFEDDSDLVAVFTFLAKGDCKGIGQGGDDVCFYFTFSSKDVHPVDFLFNGI